ncbi:hypothetical protein D3C87_1733560 [compost metagenome]
MDPAMLVGQALAHHDALPALEQRPRRFLQHQHADKAEQHQEAQCDDEVQLARIAEQVEGRHAAKGAQYA